MEVKEKPKGKRKIAPTAELEQYENKPKGEKRKNRKKAETIER